MNLIQIFRTPNWRGLKIFLYTFQELARFIVQWAREHYLIPCKKLAPESSIGKNGSKNKIDTWITHFFVCIFSFFQYFVYFSFLIQNKSQKEKRLNNGKYQNLLHMGVQK